MVGAVLAWLVVGLLGTAAGPIAGGGSDPSVIGISPLPDQTYADVDPTPGDAEPIPSAYPAPPPGAGYIFYEDYVSLDPLSPLDLDEAPPWTDESGDVEVVLDGNGTYVTGPSAQALVKAPSGVYIPSPDGCAELLADDGQRRSAVPVFPDDTVCLRTDEGRIARLFVQYVLPDGRVEVWATVWTPDAPPTE
ncbi:hypothetical protein ACFYXF_22060 [Streptomyces sp. NPDC002680]|uniref:hypothetical protein n=1 Tax=Streptomyces sp. NPDC002680 TaxID=3364659 RepID=UPI0036A31CAD